jgi:glycosyltransferase involved in cell wall biosynthesis
MRIHQFVHTLAYGDAISSEALTIKRLLKEAGIESTLYVVNAHDKLAHETRGWEYFEEDLKQAGEGVTAVLLHFSIASPLNELFLKAPGIRRAVIYHNLTPENWFMAYNARVTADLRRARTDLERVIESADLVLGDSSYNLTEVQSHCRGQSRVLPLVLDKEKWSCGSNAGIARILRGNGCRNILSVGRIAPNKCIEDLIKVFYFYHHKIEKKSRLWLIGSDIDTEIYAFELKRLAFELRLEEAVNFAGAVADSELKAFYENCDAYLCTSEHEGFCVPLIEAMYFGLPVIAYDSCAVADTVAGGGLVVARKAHAEIAELISLVISDQKLRSELREAGHKRAADFSLKNFRKRIEELLIEPLSR